MRINARYCKLGGLLLLALATMYASHRHSAAVNKTAENTAEQQARVQIVDQVEPLFRALFPDQDVLRFQAVQTPLHHKGSLRDNLWSVDCLDTNSNVIAQVLWNVDTKRALRFGPSLFYTSLQQKHSPQQPVDEKRAVALTREWTARLRPVSGEALQQSGYQINRFENIWIVRLHLPDGLVFVWINARSGELVNAYIQEISSTTPGVNREKQR